MIPLRLGVAFFLPILWFALHHGWTVNAFEVGISRRRQRHHVLDTPAASSFQQHLSPSKDSLSRIRLFMSTTTSKNDTNSVLTGRLLEAISQRDENNSNSSNNNDEEIKNLILQLTENNKLDINNNNNNETNWDTLFGYYNVSCTLTTRPNDNPVGGKWTRNRRATKRGAPAGIATAPQLWIVRRTLQHILTKRVTTATTTPADEIINNDVVVAAAAAAAAPAVAQAINAIRLDLLFGWIPVWILLRGDVVPLHLDNNEDDDGDDNKRKRPAVLPNLSSRAVRIYFDRPRIAFGKKIVFSLGPTSSVVLDTPYVDDRIRIGKGGTSGTLFVFQRVPDNDTEATAEWKWLLDKDRQMSFVTKQKAATTLGLVATVGGVCSRLLVRGGISQTVALAITLFSSLGLIWVALGTGGIETRGDTYARGK